MYSKNSKLGKVVLPSILIINILMFIPIVQGINNYQKLFTIIIENKSNFRDYAQNKNPKYISLYSNNKIKKLVTFSTELKMNIDELDKKISLNPNFLDVDKIYDNIFMIIENLRGNLISSFFSIIFFNFLLTLFLTSLYHKQLNVIKEIKRKISLEKEINIRTINIYSEERKQIARELHDGIAQELALSRMYVDCLESSKYKEKLAESFNHTFHEIKKLCYELRIDENNDRSLENIVTNICNNFKNRNDINIELLCNISGFLQLSNNKVLQFTRIINEAFTNVIKHSNSSNIEMSIHEGLETINITIVDYGVGFDIVNCSEGLGIKGIKERAELINASVYWQSNLSNG